MEKTSQTITFYRNGDPHFRGLTTSVNHRSFTSLEALQLWLNERIETTAGCRYLFRLPDGHRIRDIEELENGKAYVVSSVKRLIIDCAYGQSRERFWYNRRTLLPDDYDSNYPRDEAVHDLRDEQLDWKVKKKLEMTPLDLLSTPPVDVRQRRRSDPEKPSHRLRSDETHIPVMANGSGGMRKTVRQPRVVTIISNTHRNSWRRVLINPGSMQPFEEMVRDFTNLVVLAHPPCIAMYTVEQPFVKITSFSHLFHNHADKNSFIVCGQEFFPQEMQSSVESRVPKHEPSSIDTTPRSTIPSRPASSAEITLQINGKDHVFYAPKRNRMIKSRLTDNGKTMQLDWVYGFSMKKLKSVLVAPQGELVYCVGNLVVLHSPNSDSQRFYTEHQSPINALAIHASGEVAATCSVETLSSEIDSEQDAAKRNDTTGHNALATTVRVWSISDLYTLKTFHIDVVKARKIVAIDLLAETVGGLDLMVLADESSPFCIYLINWRAGKVLLQVETSHSHFGHLRLHMFDSPFELLTSRSSPTHGTDSERIRVAVVTSGKHHLSLWRFSAYDKEYKLTHVKTVSMAAIRNGSRIQQDSESDTSSVAHSKPTISALECDFHSIILGDSEGTITVWRLPGPGDESNEEEENGLTLRTGAAAVPLDDHNSLPDGAVIGHDGKLRFLNDTPFAESLKKRTRRAKAALNGRHRMFQLRNAHDKPIVSLCFFNDGTLISASADNEIKAWDTISEYQLVKSRFISAAYGSIMSVKVKNVNLIDGALYLMTNSAYVLEGSLQTKFSNILHSHGNTVQCLAVHPREHAFVSSCAGERLVCKWSAISHRILWKTIMDCAVESCALHPDGRLVAIGLSNSQLAFLSSENGQHLITYHISGARIFAIKSNSRSKREIENGDSEREDDNNEYEYDQAIGNNSPFKHVKVVDGNMFERSAECIRLSFSPDAAYLAVACQDGTVHIVLTAEQPQSYRHFEIKSGTLSLANPVRNFDWSDDSHHLRIVTDQLEQSFWFVPEMKNLPAADCRNLTWTTASCTLGYHAAKPWQRIVESGSDALLQISASAQSVCRDLVAIGYSNGEIMLLNPFKARNVMSRSHDSTGEREHAEPETSRRHANDKLPAHSTNYVTAVRRVDKNSISSIQFLFDDSFLLSLQSNSNVIFQWKLTPSNYSEN